MNTFPPTTSTPTQPNPRSSPRSLQTWRMITSKRVRTPVVNSGSDRARLRLEVAMRRADEADDPDTWLGLVPSYQRYVNSGEAERGLVSGIVSHANQSRAKLRTRTGRLVTAQRLEGLVPPQLVERCLSTHADLSSAFALAEIVKARLLLDM